MRYKVTLLSNLEEGDKFQFANEDGTLKSTREYFVEGQYPKFNCTTVCAKDNIKPCSSGNGENLSMVTGVEDYQWVRFLPDQKIDICHKVKYIR